MKAYDYPTPVLRPLHSHRSLPRLGFGFGFGLELELGVWVGVGVGLGVGVGGGLGVGDCFLTLHFISYTT